MQTAERCIPYRAVRGHGEVVLRGRQPRTALLRHQALGVIEMPLPTRVLDEHRIGGVAQHDHLFEQIRDRHARPTLDTAAVPHLEHAEIRGARLRL